MQVTNDNKKQKERRTDLQRRDGGDGRIGTYKQEQHQMETTGIRLFKKTKQSNNKNPVQSSPAVGSAQSLDW